MSSVSEVFSSILSHFNLRVEDCRKPVASTLLDEISLKFYGDWKFLSSQLGLEDNVAEDIDRKPIDEKGKRREFFREWKQRKGFEATYERLILALLKCEQRQDAENVCELLSLHTSSTAAPAQPSSAPAATTRMHDHTVLHYSTAPVTTFSGHTLPQQSPSTAPANTSTAPVATTRMHDHPPLYAQVTTFSGHTPPQQPPSAAQATTLSDNILPQQLTPSTEPATTSSDHTPPQLSNASATTYHEHTSPQQGNSQKTLSSCRTLPHSCCCSFSLLSKVLTSGSALQLDIDF